MKRIISIALILLSMSSMAASYSQEKLDRINAYIETLINDAGESVIIDEVQVDDQTKLLTAVGIEMRTADLPSLVVSADIVANKKDVKLSAAVKADIKDLNITYTDVTDLLSESQVFVEMINADGNFVATLTTVSVVGGMEVAITLEPAAGGRIQELKAIKIDVMINVDGKISASVAGTFETTEAATQTLRVAISNIVSALSNGTEPKEADFDSLSDMVDTLLDEASL